MVKIGHSQMRLSTYVVVLLVLLGGSVQAQRGGRGNDDPQALRRSHLRRAAQRRSAPKELEPLKMQEEPERRSLKKSGKKGGKKDKKSTDDDAEPPLPPLSSAPSGRVVVNCPDMSKEDCMARLSGGDTGVRIIHDLGSHGVAIEVDPSRQADLTEMGMSVSEDKERFVHHIEESMQFHRGLEENQTIPEGLWQIRAPEVWAKYNVTGEGVRVCVMDTGVAADHPDFAETNMTGYNGTEAMTPWYEDKLGHGTHVTGIVAASDNDEGVVGVAPGVEVFVVRVFKDNGRLFGSDIAAAALVCRNASANIINLSLGGSDPEEVERLTFEQLFNEGIIAVASSGNSGRSNNVFPAAYPMVVSVAASDKNGNIAPFSTINGFVNIAAPGMDVLSTSKTGGYSSSSGTSLSAPHVTGVLALMISYHQDADPLDLVSILIDTAKPPPNGAVTTGVVDALASMDALNSGNFTRMESFGLCGSELKVDVHTDDFGFETAYRLIDARKRMVLWQAAGVESNAEYSDSECIDPDGCYLFEIRDSFGDGITGEGNGITLQYRNRVMYRGGDFGYGGYMLVPPRCRI